MDDTASDSISQQENQPQLVPEDKGADSDVKQRPQDIMKKEEDKLQSKYPKPLRGPALLQQRINRGQKYFDSGDYNMAKATVGGAKGRPARPGEKPGIPELEAVAHNPVPRPENIPHPKPLRTQSNKPSPTHTATAPPQ